MLVVVAADRPDNCWIRSEADLVDLPGVVVKVDTEYDVLQQRSVGGNDVDDPAGLDRDFYGRCYGAVLAADRNSAEQAAGKVHRALYVRRVSGHLAHRQVHGQGVVRLREPVL